MSVQRDEPTCVNDYSFSYAEPRSSILEVAFVVILTITGVLGVILVAAGKLG